MMVLYSGTTCPFSHRCRFVLFEKGMDFEIRDVDLYNKPEDINVMNPYGQVPILVERDLILYESNIINEYIDERFPHPQLMPADPVMRARARLFLFNFEIELYTFVHIVLNPLENKKAPIGVKPRQERKRLLFTLYHLPRSLHQLMSGLQRPFADLAEHLREFICNHAREHIQAAARCKRHDHRDRAIGIRLGLRLGLSHTTQR